MSRESLGWGNVSTTLAPAEEHASGAVNRHRWSGLARAADAERVREALLADGESAASALNAGYHLAYLIAAGLVLVAIAIALSVLRVRQPEAAPEPVPDAPAEPIPGADTAPAGAPAIRIRPLPAYADAPGAGCVETGMRVVIGCGGCTATAP